MDRLAEIERTQERLAAMLDKMAKLMPQQHPSQSDGSGAGDGSVSSDIFKEFMASAMGMFKSLQSQIDGTRLDIDRVETNQRAGTLLLRGVAEDEKEDLYKTVTDILHSKLSLTDFSPMSLSNCYRLGRRAAGVTRSVVVTFASIRVRRQVWQHKAKLKGSSLSIHEFLTRTRQLILGEARKHFGVGSCWSLDGVIHVRLPDGSRSSLIQSNTLDDLKRKFPVTATTETVAGPVGTKEDNVKPRPKRVKAK